MDGVRFLTPAGWNATMLLGLGFDCDDQAKALKGVASPTPSITLFQRKF